MTAPAASSPEESAPVRPARKPRGSAQRTYATKAKVAFAIEMAKLAGIEKVGSIEFGPDGTIRIAAPGPQPVGEVDDEIAKWRARKART